MEIPPTKLPEQPKLEQTKENPINPSHYKGTAVDDFIELFKLGFRLGNVVKYIARSPNKGATLQDLQKAR